jgi:hypothetical protein
VIASRSQHHEAQQSISGNEVSPAHGYDTDDFQYDTRRHVQKVPPFEPVLIELTASASSSGRTSFLYLLTAIAILPRSHNGRDSAVVWLDADAQFSAARLCKVCVSFLDQSIDASTRQDIVREALRHVHVFPILSSKSLLDILEALPSYLTQEGNEGIPKHHSSHQPLSLVALDAAQAFYWPDRFDAEITRLESVGMPSVTNTLTPVTTRTIEYLKALQTRFECSVMYTTNHLLTQRQHAPSGPYPVSSTTNPQTPNRPNLSQFDTSIAGLSPWTTSATLSLTFSRVHVPQFASHMSVQECLRDRNQRSEAVGKGRIRVRVNDSWLERVVRDREVRDRLVSIKNEGGFVLKVDEHSVSIER